MYPQVRWTSGLSETAGLQVFPAGHAGSIQFPILRGLAPALASYDGAAELERGLDILISGLQAQLALSSPGSRDPAPAMSLTGSRRRS